MATVRYFAGAREAAGTETESVDATTVGELHAALVARHAALADVLPRCSLLVGGVRASSDDTPLGSDQTVDVLPPFAGG
ncbi:molybdopterin synthase sulfur carrier subunit [Cellulosimicrobium cellulans]|uniref:Molybdopterin synthase sulfur carrier subunit n=1 Tax=Cellulosimicrobium cellulans TaxID=1710 RepID=A0A1Y0HS96_CELCE|nr:MoaD/ThiS family protein [Cellulosimicrobium cellulans]ARU51032.1 molybdopterin synthase sulfur carrier subunit [Cellulosimicrobium cellulans]